MRSRVGLGKDQEEEDRRKSNEIILLNFIYLPNFWSLL
jgi:hypothetical protein